VIYNFITTTYLDVHGDCVFCDGFAPCYLAESRARWIRCVPQSSRTFLCWAPNFFIFVSRTGPTHSNGTWAGFLQPTSSCSIIWWRRGLLPPHVSFQNTWRRFYSSRFTSRVFHLGALRTMSSSKQSILTTSLEAERWYVVKQHGAFTACLH